MWFYGIDIIKDQDYAVVINNKIAISNVEIMFGVLESVNHNLTENVN